MNIKLLNKSIDEVLKALENLKTVINEETEKFTQPLLEMAPFITELPFLQFKHKVLTTYEYKKARQKLINANDENAYKLYPELDYENKCLGYLNNGVIITNYCIEHVTKKHPNFNDDLWQEFLACCNPNTDTKVKATYDGKSGKRWVYKCYGTTNCFGYVVDLFEKAKPQVVTVFTSDENSVDNWITNTINAKPNDYQV